MSDIDTWLWLSYLVVAVGWSGSLDLHKNATDTVSKRRSEVVTLRSRWERLIYYLHSHWLCSTKDNSMSSCFMNEVFISCVQNRKTSRSGRRFCTEAIKFACPGWYLHRERVCERGDALQSLVSAAAAASSQRHAGRDEKAVSLSRQLPPHLHQRVARLASAARVHFQPPSHWRGHTFAHQRVGHTLFSLKQGDKKGGGRHTFSTFPGFGRVCWPPVSELRGKHRHDW